MHAEVWQAGQTTFHFHDWKQWPPALPTAPTCYGHIRAWLYTQAQIGPFLVRTIQVPLLGPGSEPSNAEVIAWVLSGRLHPDFLGWQKELKRTGWIEHAGAVIT